MCDFYPGMEVICVDDTWPAPSLGDPGIREGEVYTVKRVCIDPYGRCASQAKCSSSVEVILRETGKYGMYGFGFCACRFRPVQRKSLPECLTRLLDTPVEREVERA